MHERIWIPKGIYHDRLRTVDGLVTNLGWRSNLVVDRCRSLLAALMRGDAERGLRLLMLGRGEDAWDDVPPDAPEPDDEALIDPNPFEIELSDEMITYLDEAGNPTEAKTHRLEISLTLEPGTPPLDGEESFPLREFGLFGEVDGEAHMIDYVRHPVIHKQADDTLTRTIRLIF